MTLSPEPRQKMPFRAYLGGIATMFFIFGIMNYLKGQDVPWGYQQTGGVIAALIGIVLLAFAKFILK